MLQYFIVILILSHSIIYCSAVSENDVDDSLCIDYSELEDMCSTYCFRMMKPLLGYAKEHSSNEDRSIEFNNKIKELEINNIELSIKILLKDQIIANLRSEMSLKDKLITKLETNNLIVKNCNATELEIQNCRAKMNNLNRELKEYKVKTLDNYKNQLSCIPFGNSNGIHTINLFVQRPFDIYCDSKIAGNGWTIIQRRINGDIKFNRSWNSYKVGFGDLNGNFFIGLDNLHMMTESQKHELYIQLGDVNGAIKYAHYDDFAVGSENTNYAIKSLGKYKGTAGDSLKNHINMTFSTFDHNIDADSNCGAWLNGGWWYGSCGYCNLNGLYRSTGLTTNFQGIIWTTFSNDSNGKLSLTNVQMMIRPKSK